MYKEKQTPDACIDPRYQIPDDLWRVIEVELPEEPPKPLGGRPRADNRKMMTAIFYVLRTGCQWKALPRCLGPGSTAHDRFQQWERHGVFRRLFELGLLLYDTLKGLDWQWQSMDGAITKAPLGKEMTGPNPTDRGKKRRKAQPARRGQRHPAGHCSGPGQSPGCQAT